MSNSKTIDCSRRFLYELLIEKILGSDQFVGFVPRALNLQHSLEVCWCPDAKNPADVRSVAGRHRVTLGGPILELPAFIESVIVAEPARGIRRFWRSASRSQADRYSKCITLFVRAVEFIVAHEFGHVVGGHFGSSDRPRCFSERLAFSNVDDLLRTDAISAEHVQEAHADAIGLYLLLVSSGLKGRRLRRLGESDLLAASCAIFFMTFIPSWDSTRQWRWRCCSHPHPIARLRIIGQIPFAWMSVRAPSCRHIQPLLRTEQWQEYLRIKRSAGLEALAEESQLSGTAYELAERMLDLDHSNGGFRTRLARMVKSHE